MTPPTSPRYSARTGTNIAAVTQRNHRILQKLVGGGVFDDIVQFGADGILGLADLAAQLPQGGTGGIRHLLRGK